MLADGERDAETQAVLEIDALKMLALARALPVVADADGGTEPLADGDGDIESVPLPLVAPLPLNETVKEAPGVSESDGRDEREALTLGVKDALGPLEAQLVGLLEGCDWLATAEDVAALVGCCDAEEPVLDDAAMLLDSVRVATDVELNDGDGDAEDTVLTDAVQQGEPETDVQGDANALREERREPELVKQVLVERLGLRLSDGECEADVECEDDADAQSEPDKDAHGEALNEEVIERDATPVADCELHCDTDVVTDCDAEEHTEALALGDPVPVAHCVALGVPLRVAEALTDAQEVGDTESVSVRLALAHRLPVDEELKDREDESLDVDDRLAVATGEELLTATVGLRDSDGDTDVHALGLCDADTVVLSDVESVKELVGHAEPDSKELRESVPLEQPLELRLEVTDCDGLPLGVAVVEMDAVSDALLLSLCVAL